MRHACAVRRFATAFLAPCPVGVGQSGFPCAFVAIKHLHRLAGHDGRDGVLIYKLRMTIASQQDAEIVKRSHDASQLDAVDKENSEWVLALANRIQEHVLEVLRPFRHFSCLSPIPNGALVIAPIWVRNVKRATKILHA
jgi:hypothetical protein